MLGLLRNFLDPVQDLPEEEFSLLKLSYKYELFTWLMLELALLSSTTTLSMAWQRSELVVFLSRILAGYVCSAASLSCIIGEKSLMISPLLTSKQELEVKLSVKLQCVPPSQWLRKNSKNTIPMAESTIFTWLWCRVSHF